MASYAGAATIEVPKLSHNAMIAKKVDYQAGSHRADDKNLRGSYGDLDI